jgi:N-acetylglucosamine malate deacetylase 1
MAKKNSVLVVAAHPDDEALGCFGTLLKHRSKGDKINLVFLTDGVSSRKKNNKQKIERRKNCIKAAKLLDLNKDNIFFLDYPDNMMDSVPLLNVVKDIEKIKKKIMPDTIYTHFSNDLNVDHRIAFQAAVTSSRPKENETVKKIFCFEILSSTEWADKNKIAFNPNYFVDISEYINTKINALKFYEKEMMNKPNSRSIENVKNLSSYRGSTVGMNFAEAFFIERIND